MQAIDTPYAISESQLESSLLSLSDDVASDEAQSELQKEIQTLSDHTLGIAESFKNIGRALDNICCSETVTLLGPQISSLAIRWDALRKVGTHC